jgi:hypothetical protein
VSRNELRENLITVGILGIIFDLKLKRREVDVTESVENIQVGSKRECKVSENGNDTTVAVSQGESVGRGHKVVWSSHARLYSEPLVSEGMWFQGDCKENCEYSGCIEFSTVLGCLIHFSHNTTQLPLKTHHFSTNPKFSHYPLN